MRHLIEFTNFSDNQAQKLIQDIIDEKNTPNLNQYEGTVVMKFDEPSTRTKISFSSAANKLGLYQIDLTKETSAAEKGENIIQEIETLIELGVDALVIRTNSNNKDIYNSFKNLGIVSAGFGKVSHPTQALVDAATIINSKNLDLSKPIIFCGDVRHSRVFNSAKELFPKLGLDVGICCPDDFIPEDFEEFKNIKKFNNIEEAIQEGAALELLRTQKERIEDMQRFNKNNFIEKFQLTNKKLAKSSNDLIVLHPMPMNIGFEINEDVIDNPKLKHLEQLSYGIPSKKVALKYALEKI